MHTPSALPVLFSEALNYSAADRERFLDERCGHDPALRRQLVQLLDCDARAEAINFLARTPVSGSRVLRLDAAPVVGGYVLREELGRGGMGMVYLGERVGEFRRVAAVKLGPPGPADARLLERFRAERQLLAALDHPNIARIYDGGATDDGRLYFVMELVRGDRLDRHADARRLPTRDRVGLFTTACRAVAYAHLRGVIHRDLKPGNILVTDDGVVKVVDFGLATRTALGDDDATLTHTGDLLGTPGYCPPEQARGHGKAVTPAADVFALGATLYALLTGRAPFHTDSLWESIRLTLDAEPVPPSHLVPTLPQDLESICLKCLDKDPTRRYPTADALADDLDRFLTGQPTVARPVTAPQRAWRWARRHPLPAGLLTILTVVIVASIATVIVLWRNAEQSAEHARRSAAAAAERTRTARQALQSYTAAAARLFLTPEQASSEERAALARGLELYEQLLADGSDNPDEEADHAYDVLRLADGMARLGEQRSAERANLRAVDTLQRLVDTYPHRDKFAHHLAEGTIQLAGLLWVTNRNAEGIEVGRRAVRLAEALAARRPDSAEYVGMCAALQRGLGARLTQPENSAEGEQLLAKAVLGCQNALRRQPEHWPRYEYFAQAVASSANVVYTRTRSIDLYVAAIDPLFQVIEETVRERPTDWPNLLRLPIKVGHTMGTRLAALGRQEGHRRLARLAELCAEAVRRQPANARAARDFAFIQFDLGLIAADPNEAAGRFRAALQAVEPTPERPSNPASLADRANLLASCPHPAVRDPKTAVNLIREAVTADPGLLGNLETLAICLAEAGEFPKAVIEANRHQAGRGDRWVESLEGGYHKCLWLANTNQMEAAREYLRAVETRIDVTQFNLHQQSLRARTWQRVLRTDPPLVTQRTEVPK